MVERRLRVWTGTQERPETSTPAPPVIGSNHRGSHAIVSLGCHKREFDFEENVGSTK